MDIFKLHVDNQYRVIHKGINWQGADNSLPIKPKDFVLFCDLQNVVLSGFDLSSVEFLGCRLNGTSFQQTTLQQTKFIGCFSSDQNLPTDFRNCIWKDVSVINSHLNCIFDQDRLDAWQWSDEVASLVSETLDKLNDVRYDAACKLGDSGNPVVAPSLACLLVDPEWEVRSISLEAMAKLRSHEGFPNRDSIILEWMFLCLGDEHSIVRQTARELVKVLAPTDRILLASTRRIMGRTSTSKLAGLRASLELCYYLNIEYSRLVNIKTVESLLEDEDEEVRDLSKSLLDEYNYARSLIQQVTTQKQTHLNQIDQTDATQPLDENSQLKQGSHNYNKPITESHQPPKYINNPDNSFNFEGATYMLQRRPMHPHIVINNKYEGISILEPWSGKQVLQVNFPSCYDPYGIIDGWCFRSDGKAVLTFNKQSSTACLLSLEINGASYNFESPKLQNADLRYIWENNSFWLTGGKSLGYFNLIWQEGLPVFVQKGGIKATIAHKNWRYESRWIQGRDAETMGRGDAEIFQMGIEPQLKLGNL